MAVGSGYDKNGQREDYHTWATGGDGTSGRKGETDEKAASGEWPLRHLFARCPMCNRFLIMTMCEECKRCSCICVCERKDDRGGNAAWEVEDEATNMENGAQGGQRRQAQLK